MKTAVFLSMLVLGLALYFFGELRPKLFSIESTWTDAKSERLSAVTDRLGQLAALQAKPISMHSGPDRGVTQAELVNLIKEREQLTAEFDDSLKRRQTPSNSLKAVGVFVAILGVVVWCGMRLREMRAIS